MKRNFVDNYLEFSNGKIKSFAEDAIAVEHRQANKKRDFLFVNRYQGKHIPCSPSDVARIAEEMSNAVEREEAILDEDKVIVVGFAETATALGYYVGSTLVEDGYNIGLITQTTREKVDRQLVENKNSNIGKYEEVYFSEVHSHATEQKIIIREDAAEIFKEATYILFVEDEISTGNTIINACKALKKYAPNARYGVVSYCNWQTVENQERFEENKIDRMFVINGILKEEPNKEVITGKARTISVASALNMFNSFRTGITSEDIESLEEIIKATSHMIDSELGEMLKDTEADVKGLNEEECETLGRVKANIEVIGTEEFMYVPIKIANELAKLEKYTVETHSTTRSPIDISEKDTQTFSRGTELTTRMKVSSVYDKDRQTYIYNLADYTTGVPNVCVVITDGNKTDELEKELMGIYGEGRVLVVKID